jgi:transposase-like protein
MPTLLSGQDLNVRRALREIKAFEWEGDYRPAVRQAVKDLLEGRMEGERTEWLEREPWEREAGGPEDYRNGYSEKGLETEVGEVRLRVPRTRSGKFYPTVVSKYVRRPRHVTELVAACFLLGLSTRKAAQLLAHSLGIAATAQTVSNLTKTLDGHAQRYHARGLNNRYRFLYLDGVVLRHKGATRALKRIVLCAYGIRHDGVHEMIDFMQANSESTTAWEGFLQDLYRRGLTGEGLELVITDGGAGLHAALEQVYPRLPRQRCWAHKVRNISDKVPKAAHEEIQLALARIWNACSRAEAVKAYWEFTHRYRRRYPEAVACLEKDIEDLLQFFSLAPRSDELQGLDAEGCEARRREIWRKTRTTNLIERCFVEVRRRTRPMGTFQNKESMERILYAVFAYLNGNWEDRPLAFFTQIS